MIVIALPIPTDAVECTAHVRFDHENDHLMTGEFSATAGASEPYSVKTFRNPPKISTCRERTENSR
jgi:hypothetical protein